MGKSKKEWIPCKLSDKGQAIKKMTNLPKTEAFGVFSEGISLPNSVFVERIPKSKKKKVRMVWEKEFIIK